VLSQLSAVTAGIDDFGVTITGGTGTGHFLPTFHIFGVESDTSPDTSVGPSICVGDNVCDVSSIPGNPGIPRFFGSQATLANIDGFFTPPMDSTTSFTFGTPFTFFFFYGGYIDLFLGTPGGSVTSDLTLRFAGYQIVDDAGNPIPGAQVHSQFLDAVSTPEPEAALMGLAAIAVLGLAAARRKGVAWRQGALALAPAMALVGSPIARAQSIPIINASFEEPAVRPGLTTGSGMPGWISKLGGNQQNQTAVTGVAHFSSSSFSPPTDGSQVGYIEVPPPTKQPTAPGGIFTSIFQMVGVTWTANTTYTLSADFYVGPGRPPDTVSLGLSDGPLIDAFPGNLVTLVFSPGGNATLQFSMSPGDSRIGKPIGVVISAENESTDGFDTIYFDNVRLEATPALVVPIPCNTTLEVIDTHGVLLKQAHLFLPPGTIQTMDFPSTAQGPEPMEVTPRWFLTEGSASFSLEVFDSTDLRTRLFTNWADGSVSKAGNLDSGPVTIARGDTGRLKVYCDGSVRVEATLRFESCQAGLTFHDANGGVLKQSRMTLAPGTAAFLDLSFDETRSIDRRAVVIPSLNVSGGPAVGGFAVLDGATGITITQSFPAAVQSVAR
jgi:hypothetical protein